jgi:hypothetical protein
LRREPFCIGPIIIDQAGGIRALAAEVANDLKTAKALGLTMPQSMLQTRRRGDRMSSGQWPVLVLG